MYNKLGGFTDRLRFAINNILCIEEQEFAEKIGISKQILSNILNGRTEMSLYRFVIIRSKYPNLNYDWLAYNEGEPELSDEQRAIYEQKNASKNTLEQTSIDALLYTIELQKKHINLLEKQIQCQ